MTSQTRYIRAGWLIDGTGTTIQQDVLLTLKQGKIAEICSCPKGELPDPSLVVDFSHCTLIPPLVDCHVHLALSPTDDQKVRKEQLNTPYEQRKKNINTHLNLLLQHGIAAIRDGGDRHGHTCLYKHELTGVNQCSPLPQLKVTNSGFYASGCYGAFLGQMAAKTSTLPETVAQTPLPIDHVKLFNSGVNSLTQFGRETAPQFSLDTIKGLSSSLKKKKLPLMVHANGQQPVANAVNGGCSSIEHGFFMGDENLQRMAELQTFWVPTAVTMKTLLGLKVGDSDVVERTLDSQLEQLVKARHYGVPVAVGTDAGSMGIEFGTSVSEELQLLQQASYSLAEVIACATTKGGELLGTKFSSPLLQSKPASFLAVKSAPSQLLANLSFIEAVQFPDRPLFFPKQTAGKEV